MDQKTAAQVSAAAQTLRSTEPTSGTKLPPKQGSGDELKRRFMQVANAYLQRTEQKSFEVYNRELLNDLFLYFVGSSESRFDLRKGMWLDGTVGSGKTTLMRVFREFSLEMRRSFRMETASEIAGAYAATGSLDTYLANAEGYSRKPVALCIDELGREPLPALHYGNKLNVMQHIIQQRYGIWQSIGLITHVTTNLSPMEVTEKYEDFVFDRCRHMFNMVSFTGASRR